MLSVFKFLLFPILILLHGVVNSKEVFEELKSLYNKKEITSDSVPSSSELYKKAVKVLEGDE